MIEKLRGIRIKGRCFSAKTSLMFFNKEKSRISIIYGKNGSGKSTLSKAIQNSESDLSTETISRDNTTLLIPESNIAVFNEDFIKRNVDVKSEGLDAVILFGEQNEFDSKIQKHKDQIKDIMALRDAEEQKINIFEDSKNTASPNYKISKIKERLRSKDGWIAREQKLKGKSTNLTAIALKSIFETEPETPNLNSAYEKYKEMLLIIENSKYGKIVNGFQILSFNNNFWTEIKELLSEKIEKPILSERDKLILQVYEKENADFINQIKHNLLLSERSFCPYCFRSMSDSDKQDILVGIEKVLSKFAKEHEAKLKRYYNIIQSHIKLLDQMQIIADSLKNLFITDFDFFDAQFHIVNQILNGYSEKVLEKINSLYNPIIYYESQVENEIKKMNDAIQKLESDRKKYNDEVTKVEKSKEKAINYSQEIAY